MARVGDVPEDETATSKVLEIFKDIAKAQPNCTSEAWAILTLATVLSEKE